MKNSRRRSGRVGAWPLVLLAACGVVEGTRPIESVAEIAALPVAEASDGLSGWSEAEGAAEPFESGPLEGGRTGGERVEPAFLPVVSDRSDLRCEPGVDEEVPLPHQPCPPEMAHIGQYCIDRWEAHLVLRDETGTRRHPHYLRPDEEGVTYIARSAPGVFPQGYISRHEAQAACQAAGKRLCRWIEWRRGCQGGNWWRFPYGNTFDAEACNHVKVHLFGRIHGKDPRLWKQSDFNDPRMNQEPGFLAKTGQYEECVSPDGIYDAVGNLHEWVIDRVTVPFMDRLYAEKVYRAKQPWRDGNGMFLGGFYSTRGQHGPGCYFTTAAHGPGYHDYSTGFRCCRDADIDETDDS